MSQWENSCFQRSHKNMPLLDLVQVKIVICFLLGSYMYAEGNDGKRGDHSDLISVPFKTLPGQSIQFYYHMYDNTYWVDIGSLQVKTINNKQ